jgi:ATP-binding protein involved in chromosome partitioning
MVESGAVTNVVTLEMRLLLICFAYAGDAHQEKRRRYIKKTIHDLVSPEAKVKVNTKVEAAVAESPNQIKGKSIPGIKILLPSQVKGSR